MSREEGRCSECGAALSDDGSCHACLFDLGLRTTQVDPPDAPLVPGSARIGPYRLRGVLGEGGMGIVYDAEQEHPIRRRVALKIIKPGMDSNQVIARFESERQALALMSHPNVAKVLDAGVTGSGRSYFVMEYVPGLPITDHGDRHRLSVRERLALFLQACEAVQHAHQKGIIHRDIKPSNVLVTMEGDRQTVKVIDFGVAKATSQRLTERTLFTQQGVVIGTPEYMSPEQAGMTVVEVDTRADIYSLGVVLYELCVGALPFDPRMLRDTAALEMLRIIREDEPPRPARRFQSLGDTASEMARRRRTDRTSLARMLAGELEWITLKALEKSPARRYASASELGADIQRYLDDEAVLARPQTAAYRIRKFVRRHRGAVAAATGILLVLFAGLAASTILYVRAAKARDTARLEAEKARAINDFLQETMGSAEPGKQGRQVLMVDVMKRAASQVDASFPDQPEVRAELHGTIGGVFDHLGMMNEAQEEIRKVLALARASLGEDAPETLNTRVWLGRMYFESRQYEKAIEEFSGALDRARRALGPANIVTAESMHLLGNVYNLSGRQREAEPLLLEALRLEEAIGPGDFLTGTVHMSTATLYMYSQRYDQAEHHWRRALEILRGTVGEIHWLTLRSEEELASVYTREGRLDLAEPLARHSLETSRRELGEHHTQTDISAGMVAELEVERGNFTEAERIMREQVARHRTMDMGDRILPFTLRRLAYVLARGGRDDAVEVGREALAQTIAQFGERHFTVAGAWRTLAFALFKREHPDFERSVEASRKAADLYRALFGDLHPYLAGTLQDEGRMEHARGRHEQAAALFAQALRIYDDLGLDAPWATSELKSDLGGCLAETGRTTEAQQLLDEAWTFLHERRGDADRVTVENVRRRIALYEATGRPDEAARLRANLPG